MATTVAAHPQVASRWRRFTVAVFERMGEVGIFTEDDRVELIAGAILDMDPLDGPHVNAVNRLTRCLSLQVGDEVFVSVQNPVVLDDDSEPQPDVTLLRRQHYGRNLPMARDVALAVEVAASSLAYDRDVKLPLYAAAGIPESWLFDLVNIRLERHTEPGPDGYRLVARAGRGESLASTVLPGVTLAVDALLG
ncbi:MAG TPA: Uma2 family endonuclease [Thermomicrobiales bacterium]|nr:Uma2 family endonuclease [Thermomicrobiales bacterium]